MMGDNMFTTTRLFIGETYSMETPAFTTGIFDAVTPIFPTKAG